MEEVSIEQARDSAICHPVGSDVRPANIRLPEGTLRCRHHTRMEADDLEQGGKLRPGRQSAPNSGGHQTGLLHPRGVCGLKVWRSWFTVSRGEDWLSASWDPGVPLNLTSTGTMKTSSSQGGHRGLSCQLKAQHTVAAGHPDFPWGPVSLLPMWLQEGKSVSHPAVYISRVSSERGRKGPSAIVT